MSISRSRVRRRLIGTTAAVAMFAAPGALGAPSASQQLNDAAALLRDGSLVRAKHIVASLDTGLMSQSDRERAFELLSTIDRRLRHADPVEVSLQKAEVAILTGDLRSADRHATAARRHPRASNEQQSRASDLLDQASAAKAELEPIVQPTIDTAVADFEAGRYADAKAGFDLVYRSGCRLTPAQVRVIERHRTRILELERELGAPFETATTALAVLQPGEVERVQDPRPGAPRQGEDAGEQPPMDAPQDDALDPEMNQPAPPPPTGDGLIQQAYRAEALKFLADGNAAFIDGRYAAAVGAYQIALGQYRDYLNTEEVSQAQSRLEEARVLLDQSPAPLGGEIDRRTILREQARTEFENFTRQAETQLQQGNFDRAQELAAQARLAATRNREVFSEPEFNDLIAQQQRLLQRINTQEEAARQAAITDRSQQVAQETASAREEQRAERERRIIENLDRVRELQQEQRYDEALQVVDQILFLDPNNAAGRLLRDVLGDVVIYRQYNQLQRDKAYSYARESNAIQEALVIPQDLISYPNDWPEISFRRGEPVAFEESAEDRRVLAELDSTRIPANFSNAALEDVIEYIGAVVPTLNIDVDWESLADIGINRDNEVSLSLQPVPARVVLERVLSKVSPDEFSRANWAVTDGVLVIASDEALRRDTFIRIYDIRDLTFNLPDFPDVPELDLDAVLQQTGQRGGGGGGGNIFQDNQQQRQLDEGEQLDLIVQIIQENIDYEGWRENGGTTGFIQELNGNLIVTNTARNHRAIVGLLKQLREIREIQISVDAHFLTVSQDFFEQIGFDLDIYFNAQNNQYDATRFQEQAFGGTGSPFNPLTPPGSSSSLPSDLVGTRTTDVPQWFITDVDPQTGIPTFEYGPLNTSVVAPDSLSIIPTQSNSSAISESLISSSFATAILQQNPALGIAGTFLDDVQVDFLIEATQADRRNVALTAPRLTFVNGKYANIFVATQRSYVADLTPITGTGSVAFDPTIASLNTGVTLLLRGVVSADRRYVTLTIEARVANFEQFRNVPVRAAAGGGGLAGGDAAIVESSIEAPEVSISAIQTNATVPDQGTILLGGQRIVSESEVETGVPVLSKLPVLNRFFTNRIEAKEESTLLILIKPTILIQSEQEENNFPGLLDRLGAGFGGGY